MIQFDIITIFPDIFSSYFRESIIKRAQKRKLIKIKVHNLRDFTKDVHKTVDDRPYGGGPGMILKVDIIFQAIKKIISKNKKINPKKRKIILLSAKGKKFNQKMASRLSKLEEIVLICGRYEGIDERVARYVADEEVSIGDYVLTGGEIPAMVIVDAVSRLIKGVINKESLKQESFVNDLKEYPQYTRPEIFIPKDKDKTFLKTKTKIWRVPKILLSGHHEKIKEWQTKRSKG